MAVYRDGVRLGLYALIEITSSSPTFTLKNNTAEDTDGGRESKIIWTGTQSGGEESTLAQIQASHDGASDDQKGDLIFYTNDGADGTSPTERARIDSAGNMGVGTDAPAAFFHVAGSAINMLIEDVGGSPGFLGYRANGTLASKTIVTDGQAVFALNGRGWDGSAYRHTGYIAIEVDGAPGAGDMPGRIVLSTTLDGTTSFVEHMRIDNAGLTSFHDGTIPSWGHSPAAGGIAVEGVSEFDGNVFFDGTITVGTAPDYTASNVSTDRAFDADTVAVAELADVVGTLIADMITMGLLQ